MHSGVFRRLFIGTLTAGIIAAIGLAAVVLWPIWQEYRLLGDAVQAVKKHDDQRIKSAVAAVRKVHGGLLTAPALAELLKDDDRQTRLFAVRALIELGPESDRVLSKLVAAMRDDDGRVRMLAANALRRLGPRAVPLLTWALSDPDTHMRAGAAEGLGTIGPESQSTVSLLVPLAKDDDPLVRRWSVWALGQIRPGDASLVTLFLDALRDDDASVREDGAWAMFKLGPAAVAPLLDAAESADTRFRAEVAETLRLIGTPAKDRIP